MPEQKELASMDDSAACALGPVANERQVIKLTPDALEHIDPIFYGFVRQAAFNALGLN